MKPKVYIESSIVSYLTAHPAKDLVLAGHQVATRDFWDKLSQYDVYISELVLMEVGQGAPSAAAARLDALMPQLLLDVGKLGVELILLRRRSGA